MPKTAAIPDATNSSTQNGRWMPNCGEASIAYAYEPIAKNAA
jgi:hypothetical protein